MSFSYSGKIWPGKELLLKTLERTLKLLELFTEKDPQWGITALGHATGLPVSTVHRILTILKRYGLVAQHPDTKKYSLGFAALRLGYCAEAGLQLYIRQMADPIMQRLATETQETIVLTVVNSTRDRSVCIARVESHHNLRLHLEVGRQVFLHAGASAKILLAYFPVEEIRALCRHTGLPRLAPHTITDLETLLTDLQEIREKGYARSIEETDEGAWGIAVPILDSRQQALASLGIAGPISRYSPEKEAYFVTLAQEAAEEIRAALGFRIHSESATYSFP